MINNTIQIKEIIPANYKAAKNTLSMGIRAYVLNNDIEQLEYWVDLANSYLEPYNHMAMLIRGERGVLSIIAKSNKDENPWFSVNLDIQFPEEEEIKTVKGLANMQYTIAYNNILKKYENKKRK